MIDVRNSLMLMMLFALSLLLTGKVFAMDSTEYSQKSAELITQYQNDIKKVTEQEKDPEKMRTADSDISEKFKIKMAALVEEFRSTNSVTNNAIQTTPAIIYPDDPGYHIPRN